MQVRISARLIRWPSCCACCLGSADATRGAAHTRVEGVKVIHRDTRAWAVPYCRRCISHQDAWHRLAAREPSEAVEEARLRLNNASHRRTGAIIGVAIACLLLPLLICAGLARKGEPPRKGEPDVRQMADMMITGACVCPLFLVLGIGSGVGLWFLLRPPILAAEKALVRAKEKARRRRSRQEEDAQEMLTPSCSCRTEAVDYLGWSGSVHVFDFTSREYGELFSRNNSSKIVD